MITVCNKQCKIFIFFVLRGMGLKSPFRTLLFKTKKEKRRSNILSPPQELIEASSGVAANILMARKEKQRVALLPIKLENA